MCYVGRYIYIYTYMWNFPKLGVPFGGSNKDHSVLWSTLAPKTTTYSLQTSLNHPYAIRVHAL